MKKAFLADTFAAGWEVPVRPGPTWHRLLSLVSKLKLAGRAELRYLDSIALAGNPLGDPTRRPLIVYLPPGYDASDRRYPVLYVLHGALDDVGTWLSARDGACDIERIDDCVADGAPEAIVVFIDAWTSVGGSQYLDSHHVGHYASFVGGDIVRFVDQSYRTRSGRAARAVAGHSSGGFGAFHLATAVGSPFGGLASLAGDALFEGVCLSSFMAAVRGLHRRHRGSYEQLWTTRGMHDSFTVGEDRECLDQYLLAACYAPARASQPELLFDGIGRLREDIWQTWLAYDPVRVASARAAQLRELGTIYLSAGEADEVYADMGTRALQDILVQLEIPVRARIGPGGHSDGPPLTGAYLHLAGAMAGRAER